MKTIEDKILEGLDLSESTLSQSNHAAKIAAAIGRVINQYSSDIQGRSNLVSPNGTIINLPTHYRFSGDEIEVVDSNKVYYVYLDVSKLEISYDLRDETDANQRVLDFKRLAINSAVGWKKVTDKCWKDDDSLYLLKINKTTGIISRFDFFKKRFSQLLDSVNYLNTSAEIIAEETLPEDYIASYLADQLVDRYITVDYLDDELSTKFDENSEIVRLEVKY